MVNGRHAIRIAAAVIAASFCSACHRTEDHREPALSSVSDAAAGAPSQSEFLKPVASQHDESPAGVIQNWQPLHFTGILKRFDPLDLTRAGKDEVVNPAADVLFAKACRHLKSWREVEALPDRMGQIAFAAASARGPILYQQMSNKGDWDNWVLFGVRVSDNACGAFDARGTAGHLEGDDNIGSFLIAVSAIRANDREAEKQPISPSARAAALETLGRMTADEDPGASTQGELKKYSASTFRSMLLGRTSQEVIAMLGKPVSINDGMSPGSQTYDYSSDETYLGHVPFRVVDDVTDQVRRSVIVKFDGDRVSSVRL